jgi:hypothetical protein
MKHPSSVTSSRKEVLKYCIENLKNQRQHARQSISDLEQRMNILMNKDVDDAIALEAMEKELSSVVSKEFKAKAKRARRSKL